MSNPRNPPQNLRLKNSGESGILESLQASSPPERENLMNRQNSKITALYSRLSKDDLLTGESQSIANQKMLLEQFAEQNGFANPRHFSEACDIIEPNPRTQQYQGFRGIGSNFIS
jgi:hypothetical protein